MLLKKRGPLTYRQCKQTVTVYHKDDSGVKKTVFDRAYLDFKKTQNVDKTGSREANSFLLAIPTDKKVVHVGDKVLLGIGPDVTDWPGFIPAKVDGLVVVKYEDCKFYGGKMVHQEAGG